MTAIGKTYVAILSSDMRGPLERRSAATWEMAFVKAKLLLDAAERRRDWWKGEIVSVAVSQSEQ